MHWAPEARHASVVVVVVVVVEVVVVEVVVVDVVVVDVVVVDVVVVDVVVVDVVVVDVVVVDAVVVGVVVVVSGAGHGSKRPRPNNPPQAAVVVVVHTSLATSEHVWEPHENLKSPQVTSQVWEQSCPLHWSTHAALGSVKRQHTAL